MVTSFGTKKWSLLKFWTRFKPVLSLPNSMRRSKHVKLNPQIWEACENIFDGGYYISRESYRLDSIICGPYLQKAIHTGVGLGVLKAVRFWAMEGLKPQGIALLKVTYKLTQSVVFFSFSGFT
jgi:hypothetical protein